MDALMLQLFKIPDDSFVTDSASTIARYQRAQPSPSEPDATKCDDITLTTAACTIPRVPPIGRPKLAQDTVVIESFLPLLKLKTQRNLVVCKYYLRGRCDRPDCPYYHPPRDTRRKQ